RSATAARVDPHRPFVRSMPRVRDPHGGCRGPRSRESTGAVMPMPALQVRQVGGTVRIRVLGLGNVLMSDDGFGPFVVRVLEATYECPPAPAFIGAGTPG